LTLSQLRTFVTVARLGSVKAAARALQVSEPAVSGAVGALRKELGDKLYMRAGGVIELTPGGRRLASAASDILGLADGAREAIRDGDGERSTVRVAATPPFAEFAAGPLLSVFTHRHDDIEVELQVAQREDFAALLRHAAHGGPRRHPARRACRRGRPAGCRRRGGARTPRHHLMR
jgi:DNA-binding transcriptional LysR family regulator